MEASSTITDGQSSRLQLMLQQVDITEVCNLRLLFKDTRNYIMFRSKESNNPIPLYEIGFQTEGLAILA